MSRDMWVNRCRNKIDSRFLLAQAAVLRWEQLLRGARPRIPTDHPKGMETPLRELATGAVKLDRDKFQVDLLGSPYEPPRPEPEEEGLDDLGLGLIAATEDDTAKAGDAA
jgi:DNA-directed RNA polymerase subunit K/omega